MARKYANTVPEVEAVTTKEEPKTEETPVVEVSRVPVKKAGPKLAPFIILGVVVVLIVAGIIVKTVLSTPKQIFKSYINQTYKEISNTLKEIEEVYEPNKEALEVSATLNFDTNMDTEELFGEKLDFDPTKLEFDISTGLDIPHEELYVSGGVKGSKERIGGKLLLTEGKEYLETTFYDSIINLTDELGSEVDDFSKYFAEAADSDVSLKLYDNLLKAFTKALTDSLDSDAMEKGNDEIEVLDKELKVTKNSYKLTEKNIQKLVKEIAENLLDNKDFISDLSEASGLDKSEIKDGLKEIKTSAKEISFEGKITVNIYTRGLTNKFSGIDLYVEKEKVVSVYTDGDNIDATIEGTTKVKFTVEKDGKEKKARFTVDGEKIFTATIRSFEEEKIDFDFVIYDDEDEIKGTVYLTCEEKKNTVNGEYKFKISHEDEWFELSGTYSLETKDSLDGINTKNAVDLSEVDEEEFINALKESADKDDVLKVIVDSITTEWEEEQLESRLNGYGMIPTDATEALKLLKNNKATVLYVGSNYYSESDPYYMFYNLRDSQYEYDFHSYALDASKVNEEFKTAIKDVQFTCTLEHAPEGTEKVCNEYPAILIIKDGEIKYAFRGTVSSDTLDTALKDVGF